MMSVRQRVASEWFMGWHDSVSNVQNNDACTTFLVSSIPSHHLTFFSLFLFPVASFSLFGMLITQLMFFRSRPAFRLNTNAIIFYCYNSELFVHQSITQGEPGNIQLKFKSIDNRRDERENGKRKADSIKHI